MTARNERAEARAWAGLRLAKGDWLLKDTVDWRRRLDGRPGLNDLKLEQVKFHLDILLSRLTQNVTSKRPDGGYRPLDSVVDPVPPRGGSGQVFPRRLTQHGTT